MSSLFLNRPSVRLRMIVEYYHHPPVLGTTWWLHKEVIRTTSDYKIRLGLLPGSFPAIPTGWLLILDFPRTFENSCKCNPTSSSPQHIEPPTDQPVRTHVRAWSPDYTHPHGLASFIRVQRSNVHPSLRCHILASLHHLSSVLLLHQPDLGSDRICRVGKSQTKEGEGCGGSIFRGGGRCNKIW